MDYMTVSEVSETWNISNSKNQILCSADRGKPSPILKWAGGKTQMLDSLISSMPEKYINYIEPFIGGGALYFHLNNAHSIIADSNPELINLYREIADHCEDVIDILKTYKNDEDMYYEIRGKDWLQCSKTEAAARMIYLNRTCYNGLYRLNRRGGFNTPFGKYRNPHICNEEKLRLASKLLKTSTIIRDDYLNVLKTYAKEGDFIFLDPPYIPISDYADFRRYTKEQFYESDHRNLAREVDRLVDLGCKVMLTNSNHPLVHELYSKYNIEVIQTKRNINSCGKKRKGEDVIVTTYAKS